jgi:uncharacterized protein involved in exopolysaccharide biosynthesis
MQVNQTESARVLTGSAFSAVVGVVRHNWRFLLAIVVIVELLALAFSFLVTPTYRSEVVLSPRSRSAAEAAIGAVGGQLGGISTLLGIGAGSSAENEYALAVLRSNTFTTEFINANDLLPVLFSSKWDPVAGKWKSSDPEKHPTVLDAVRKFEREIRTVIVDPKTNIVTLRIEWKDRELAASWANELASRLNEDVRRRTTADAGLSIAYLNEQLARTQLVQLRTALTRVLEEELKRQMLAEVNDEYAFRIVDPAVPSDADDFVSPNRLILSLLGLLVGITIGFLVIAVRGELREK